MTKQLLNTESKKVEMSEQEEEDKEDTEEIEFFFEKNHHYVATFKGDKIKICAEIDRGQTEYISEAYFNDNFIIITDAEYEEYEDYCWQGYNVEIGLYLDRLKAKYNFQ